MFLVRRFFFIVTLWETIFPNAACGHEHAYRFACSATVARIEPDNCCSLARRQNSLARPRASSQATSVFTAARGCLIVSFLRFPLAGGAYAIGSWSMAGAPAYPHSAGNSETLYW